MERYGFWLTPQEKEQAERAKQAEYARRPRSLGNALDRAAGLISAPAAPPPPLRSRPGIPEDVRRLVWRRDGGRCQTCGSDELLQFDHIIPIARGGSSEPENLQLLCSICNRNKGASI